MRARLAACLGPVALAASAAGCGEEPRDPGAEAAAGVAEVVAARLEGAPADVAVTCPEDLEVEGGATFSCDVAAPGAEPVEVPLSVDAAGAVTLTRAVVPSAAAEAYLEGQLAGPAEGDVAVDCGEAPLLVAAVGSQLRCEVTRASDGAVRSVVLDVLALDGTVRYRVEPAP